MSPPVCGSTFQLRFHSDLQRRSPSGHNTLLERGVRSRVGGGGDQRHSRGKDAGGREPRGTDGWKRLKERRIVRVEQTGPQKGDGSRGGNGGLRKERD